MTHRKPPTRSSAQPTWQRLGWKIALVFVGCGAVVWIIVEYHQRPVSSSSIDDWVRQQNFDPVRPFRSDFLPGTLVAVGQSRDRVAMASSEFLIGQTGVVSQASLPNTTLTIKLKASADTSAGTTQLGGGEDLNASVVLSNVELLTLPLDKVRDGVRHNTRIEQALTDHPDDLFVILEALRVGKMQLVFRDASDAKVKAKSVTDWVQATFGASAGLDQSGTVQSDAPLILGTRVARLSEASTALGGSSRETIVDAISTSDLERFRNEVASKIDRLYSNFDVFGLVIAVGNYPSLSTRAGGELPDAVRTGEGVARDLRRLVPPELANHIQVIESNEVSPKTFDPTRRLSRSDLLEGIHSFLDYVKHNSDPNKQTLVIFYYFGHGLADGMSKSVFLVPEEFVDDETKHIPDVSDRLIDIADINRQMSVVTDHAIFLIDACRAYKDQGKELIEAWKRTVKQGSDVGGILNAIQFASGIYGPTPIIFASDDGMAADTVKYPAAGLSSGTGPLGLKLRAVLNNVNSTGGGLPLSGFIDAFESPSVSLPNLESQEAAKVRGYSFTRSDFITQFGSSLIVSGDPVSALPRKQAFTEPYFDLHSRSGGSEPPPGLPSGIAQARNVGRPSGKDVDELVFAPGIGLVALDENDDVWIRGTHAWRAFQKELPIVRIGWDRDAGLLLYQWDEKILYRVRGGALDPMYTHFFSELLGESATGGFVVIRIADGGGSALFFAHGGTLREITRVASSEVFDAARDSRGRLWFTTADGLWLYDRGQVRRTGESLWRPDNIVVMGNLLYVWSEDGRMLYRLDTNTGKADALDLRDVGFGDAYIRRDFTRSFAMQDAVTCYFGFGPDVVSVSLVKAYWRAISETIVAAA
jgi:hypothetical protein